MSDDALLITATLAGDTAAFGRLVGLYQDRLYNSLLRVLGSAEDARDITQDAFVQAFVKLKSFRGSSAFYTWLYRIAYNLAMSHARREHAVVSLDGVKSTWGSEVMDGQPAPAGDLLPGLPSGFNVQVDMTDWDLERIEGFLKLIGYLPRQPEPSGR